MSTRPGLSREFIHFYSTHNTGRVIKGYNDKENNTSLDPFVLAQIFVTIIFTLIVLLFLCGCCCVARQLIWRRLERNVNTNPSRPAGLLTNVNANPSQPAGLLRIVNANPPPPAGLLTNVSSNPSLLVTPWNNIDPILPSPVQPTAPPMLQQNFRTPVDDRTPIGDSDVPPDYSAVAEQKTTTAIVSDNLNRYPKVVGGKKVETPPPDYMTVAPFK
ncbi:uncharacterized protein LOC129969615 [Argiope bruennichi]|uniref:Uncharacterized protein n=1 Tax=Argiope bruennichi TaxID=94029 RepID=A0A8T0FU08_ARGBR|nr:uncharacterized protein LOC129969615 [Argiope bruennichi]KAF8792223.1 hypothetical protein HNY73_003848 [Argiope bruennichi]